MKWYKYPGNGPGVWHYLRAGIGEYTLERTSPHKGTGVWYLYGPGVNGQECGMVAVGDTVDAAKRAAGPIIAEAAASSPRRAAELRDHLRGRHGVEEGAVAGRTEGHLRNLHIGLHASYAPTPAGHDHPAALPDDDPR